MTSAPRSARWVVTAPGPSIEHSTTRTPASGARRAGSVVVSLRSVTGPIPLLSRAGTSLAQVLTHRQIFVGGCAVRTGPHHLRWPEPPLGRLAGEHHWGSPATTQRCEIISIVTDSFHQPHRTARAGAPLVALPLQIDPPDARANGRRATVRPQRTDHPPSTNDSARSTATRRAIIGGIAGVALLVGPVALANVIVPDDSADDRVEASAESETSLIALQRSATQADLAKANNAFSLRTTTTPPPPPPTEPPPPPTTEAPTTTEEPPPETEPEAPAEEPTAGQRWWLRRSRQLRDLGRARRLRVRRQLGRQHRQRLLRRPAVLRRHVVERRWLRPPAPALPGDADPDGSAAPGPLGLGAVAGVHPGAGPALTATAVARPRTGTTTATRT